MKIGRIEDFKTFLKLREEWNTLLFSSKQNSLFLTHEWFSAWWKSFGEGYSMEVLLYRNDDGSLAGVAPLMAKNRNLHLIASREVSDYCDFFSLPERREDFFKDLLEYFKDSVGDLNKFEFINIKSSSPTLFFLPRLASEYGFAYTIHEEEEVPGMELPASFEDYLGRLSRKNRHEVRRKLKRTESLGGIRIKRTTDPGELLSSIDGFIALHRESNPSKRRFWEKRGMMHFFHELIIQLAPRGWVELNVLYAGNETAAGLLNFSYADEVLFYNSAFSPMFSSYNPGFYLFIQSIKEAVSEKKKRADFLRGREKYKYYFGGKTGKIFDLTLLAGEK
jgi:CelD/BcsL family acetyltransferase involved in cellulose biosynthesis